MILSINKKWTLALLILIFAAFCLNISFKEYKFINQDLILKLINMKKELRFFILFFLSTFPFFGQAQAPGYIGKRASISVGMLGSASITGPSKNNRGDNAFGAIGQGKIGFNPELKVEFSYTTGRYRSIELGWSKYTTGLTSYAEGDFRFSSGSTAAFLFSHLNVKSIDFAYSYYMRQQGALAPIGNRYFIGLKTSFISANLIGEGGNDFEEYNPTDITYEDLDVDTDLRITYFTAGWSISTVISDKVIFKAGMTTALPLSWIGDRDLIVLSDDRSERTLAEYKRSTFFRLFRYESIRVSATIGYLLF